MQFVGGQPGSGRPRRPRVTDEMRRLVEENVEQLVASYFDAMRNADDVRVRIHAAEKLLDRVYGRPRQELELGGSETHPVEVIVTLDDREHADAVRAFLATLIPE